MNNNDVLRSLRDILKANNTELAHIFSLGQSQVNQGNVDSFLKAPGEAGFQECSHLCLGQFLNGLVTFKRGEDPSKPKQVVEKSMTNNIVLKKLRIAFELKDDDISAMIEKDGGDSHRNRWSAFFRKADHKHYRECNDEFLVSVLKGLST